MTVIRNLSVLKIFVNYLLFLNNIIEVSSIFNSNKTDAEINLEDCYAATLDPHYHKNPDKYLRAHDMIAKYGYPIEIHHVTTQDGYILELHRIPHGRNSPPGEMPKQPVYIQHGIMASSVNWILPPIDSALAYRMADSGYDVWLGNCRGSSYSLGHINPKMHYTNTKYWDFSWHEMGYYDVPAVIDYILETTNHQKLTYIGHSMGTTMFFVCMSLRPEYNAKVDIMMALAPVAYVGNSTSFFKLLAPFSYNLQRFYQVIGKGVLMPETLRIIMNPFIASSYGRQMNYTTLPVITSHFPDKVSTKTVAHYGQNLISDTFQEFDGRIVVPSVLGIGPGLITPGKKPAQYELSKVTVPVVTFWSERDNLSNPKDVARLEERLPNVVASVRVCYPLFNHNDFLFGIYVNELVYDKLFSILRGNLDVDLKCLNKYNTPPF